MKPGSSARTSTIVKRCRERHLERQQVAELLLDHVADHAFGLSAEHVQRVSLARLVRGALQRQQPDLRAVAVADDELMLLAIGASACAATLTLARCASAVIGSPRFSRALPPKATTMHA